MKSRNLLLIFLMASSIGLLLALQGFWLKNSYEKAFLDFRKETNDIFRNTIIAARDSALVRNMERIPIDSGVVPEHGARFTFTQRIDSINVIKRKSGTGGQLRDKKSEVQIFIAGGVSADSIKAVLRPVASKLMRSHHEGLGNFFVRISDDDTLSIDTLSYYLGRSFSTARITPQFKITQDTELQHIELDGKKMLRRRESVQKATTAAIFSDSLRTDWMRFDPIHRYSAIITDFRPALVREITPQILFSGFLTLLTTAAFFIMYRSIRSQQKLMELKNDFISNITHELKTPVTTVSVALEALRDFKGLENPQTTREYLDIAQSELKRLTLLTDKILKTAAIENNGVDFEPEPIDLQETVEQILGSMKLLFEKQKATVRFEKSGDSFVVHGGSVHLTNVIYNLLDNALKYSLNDPQISVMLKADDDRVVLSVEDKGIGIPAEYKRKIFEKFFRVPTGNVHTIKGYGLGLSYVENVIKSHNGRIVVTSKPGEGSIFTLFLPKAQDRWAV